MTTKTLSCECSAHELAKLGLHRVNVCRILSDRAGLLRMKTMYSLCMLQTARALEAG